MLYQEMEAAKIFLNNLIFLSNDKLFFHNQISLFFLGLLFFASCNAQVETNLPKDKTTKPPEIATSNLLDSSSSGRLCLCFLKRPLHT